MSDQIEKKPVTIYVNTHPHEVTKERLSYEDVVELEHPDFRSHPEINYTVTFTRGHGDKPEGNLIHGGKLVIVKEGMRFEVDHSGQS